MLGRTTFMNPSRELQAILDVTQTPSGEEFKQAVRNSSIEVKDEYLGYILTQHSQRRFVEEERHRHMEQIEAAETARRHHEAIDENRRANRLSRRAIRIAIVAVMMAGLSLYWQWLDRSANKSKRVPSVSAPSLLPPAPAVVLPLTNAPTTNMPAPQKTP